MGAATDPYTRAHSRGAPVLLLFSELGKAGFQGCHQILIELRRHFLLELFQAGNLASDGLYFSLFFATFRASLFPSFLSAHLTAFLSPDFSALLPKLLADFLALLAKIPCCRRLFDRGNINDHLSHLLTVLEPGHQPGFEGIEQALLAFGFVLFELLVMGTCRPPQLGIVATGQGRENREQDMVGILFRQRSEDLFQI